MYLLSIYVCSYYTKCLLAGAGSWPPRRAQRSTHPLAHLLVRRRVCRVSRPSAGTRERQRQAWSSSSVWSCGTQLALTLEANTRWNSMLKSSGQRAVSRVSPGPGRTQEVVHAISDVEPRPGASPLSCYRSVWQEGEGKICESLLRESDLGHRGGNTDLCKVVCRQSHWAFNKSEPVRVSARFLATDLECARSSGFRLVPSYPVVAWVPRDETLTGLPQEEWERCPFPSEISRNISLL